MAARCAQPPPLASRLLQSWPWLPIPPYIALAAFAVSLDPAWRFEPVWLLSALNLVFGVGTSGTVAALGAVAYLESGTIVPLALGSGMLAMGGGFLLAGFLSPALGSAATVPMHNCAMVLAGALLCTAAAWMFAPHLWRPPGSRRQQIGVVYGFILLTLGVLGGLVATQRFPAFFIQGQGPTELRQVVLGMAIVEFVVAGILFWQAHALSRFGFFRWYGTGLCLIAVGLALIQQQSSLGDLVNWAGRWGQYLGGVYLVGGLLSTAREARSLGLSAGQAFSVSLLEVGLPFRALVDSTSEAVVILDAPGAILFWNEAARRLFGADADEVFGKDGIVQIVPEPNREATRAALTRLLRTESSLAGERLELVLGDRAGRSFPAEVVFYRGQAAWRHLMVWVIRDITERRQAEAALREANATLEARVRERAAALETANTDLVRTRDRAMSQAQEAERRADELDAVFAAMTEAVMVHDARGVPIKANREAIASLGYDPVGSDREARARRLNLRYPDGRPVPPEDLPTLRTGRGEIIRDERFIQADAQGKDRIIRYSASPLTFENRFVGTVAVWEDVTDQERVAEQLRELSQRLSYHVDNSPLAVIEWGPDMRLIRWSGAAERIFGWTAAEVLGKRMEEFRWIYDEDQPQVADVSSDLQTGADSHRFSANRNFRKDGSIIYCEWYNSSLLDEAGKLRSILSLVLDVTERVRTEEALEHTARFPDENPYPVLRVARDGTMLYANRTSGPLLRTWNCQVGKRLDVGWITRIADAYARGQLAEIEVTCDEGRVYSCILTPIPNAGYVNIYARDITERKRAEASLQQAHAELERRVRERTTQLSRAVGTLEHQAEQLSILAAELTRTEQRERRRLATILHDEHQQLLSAAKLRVSLLDRTEDPKVREACREITELLQEALAHSRSLVQELSPPVLASGGLPQALGWLARWMEEKHHLKVDLQADATAAPDAEDLTVLLFQAVRELLFNVVKHAGVESAHVALTRQDGRVQIIVSDAGVGFEPTFLRVRGGVLGGFGLFSISQRLEFLGGRLEIASAPGQGSRFTLTAPLQWTKAAALTVPAPEEQLGSPRISEGSLAAPERTGAIRVLVVDDHKLTRQGLIRLLEVEPDIEVVGEAADGEAAVARAHDLAPEVITMDISMPGMNGIEATRRIHADCPGVQVIGLSMFEDAEQGQTMREAGAVAYLAKSGPAEALLAAIRACRAGERGAAHRRTGSGGTRPPAAGDR